MVGGHAASQKLKDHHHGNIERNHFEDVISGSSDASSTAYHGVLTSNSTPASTQTSLVSRAPSSLIAYPCCDRSPHPKTQFLASQRAAFPFPVSSISRIHEFIVAACRSSFLASALAFLEAKAAHPQVITCRPLADMEQRWTLAAMLTLHLRSEKVSPVTEADLLALLWTLESFADSSRSAASTVLGDYIRHLACFDEPLAAAMTDRWVESFCGLRRDVTSAQMDLLIRVNWRVRLSDTEVIGSYRKLFNADPCLEYFPQTFQQSSIESNTSKEPPAARKLAFRGPPPAADATDRSMDCRSDGLRQAGARSLRLFCEYVNDQLQHILESDAIMAEPQTPRTVVADGPACDVKRQRTI
jgi:hypothetical protein